MVAFFCQRLLMRKFIHVDMDCFYAAVEMRDNPELSKVPLAIGGSSRRGVIATSNYVARKYGVRSAMSTWKAKQLCPELVLMPGRMALYKAVSQQVRAVFKDYTDKIEPLSLDEAYLDVTGSTACQGSAILIAQRIREDIVSQTGLTASAGIAPIKFVAKIASDENKPNGQYAVLPEELMSFLAALDLGKIPGVGKVSLQKLHERGLYRGADVLAKTREGMRAELGDWGEKLYQKCAGEFIGEVVTERIRKSVSVEHTYEYNKTSLAACLAMMPALQADLEARLARQGLQDRISRLSVKVKFSDFHVTTADQSGNVLDEEVFAALLKKAYERSDNPQVRLLGLGVGVEATDGEWRQLSFFNHGMSIDP